MTKQTTTTGTIARKGWIPDDLITFIVETGRYDVEEDTFGNIVIYVDAHEDDWGNLCAGTVGEEGESAEPTASDPRPDPRTHPEYWTE